MVRVRTSAEMLGQCNNLSSQENRFMHLASLEQQRELMRYMNSLNEWLGHDVEDRHAEMRGLSERIDRLSDGLNRLGLSRGPCKLHHAYVSTCH
jgi:hypothetical protein